MITAQIKDFRSAIALAGMAAERRNTIPILSALRCRANGKLEVAGTDLDMRMDVSIPRESGESGEFVLADFQFIAKSLGASGEKAATFATADNGLSIVAGALSILVKSQMSADDWPANGGVIGGETFSATLSTDHLRQLARVVPAISTEETRYYLNGVYFHHLDGWNYRLVSTDGHRLMMADIALPDATGVLKGAIIPRKAVSVLLRALGKSRDPIRMIGGTGSKRNVVDSTAPDNPEATLVSFAGTKGNASLLLSTKLIDGTFPDYTRVIPKANEVKAVFQIADLRRAIEAVGHPGSRVRALKLTFDKGTARFASHFADFSTDAGIEIPASHNARADFTIGFNGQYLQDILGSLEGDEVVLSMADSASPVLIQDPADTAFTAILMPMRV